MGCFRYENLGMPFHGEFSSANASALSESAARILLYGPGSTTALTVGSAQVVLITDISIMVGTALTVSIYDGSTNSPGAGNYVVNQFQFAGNGGEVWACVVPHYCVLGTWPHVVTSGAGAVDVSIRGVIIG